MKVFCIGTWKTGTTSMGFALNKLIKGKHLGWEDHIRTMYYKNEYDSIKNMSYDYDTFDDTPWNCLDVFPTMFKLHKDSKFVLTTRNENAWISSMIRFYKNDLNKMPRPSIVKENYQRQLGIFGFNVENMVNISKSKDLWIKWFKTRNEYVIDFFKDTNKLLVYNISDNLGWEPICNFLNKDIPPIEFPHKNKNKK